MKANISIDLDMSFYLFVYLVNRRHLKTRKTKKKKMMEKKMKKKKNRKEEKKKLIFSDHLSTNEE